MLNFCDFTQVYVFTTNHHLNSRLLYLVKGGHNYLHNYGEKLLVTSIAQDESETDNLTVSSNELITLDFTVSKNRIFVK